jgi:chromosome segregation ATPase
VVRPLLKSRDLELAALRADLTGVEQSLVDARQTIDRLSREAAALDARCQALEQALAAAQVSAAEDRAAHDAARLAAARTQADLDAVRAQLHAAHDRLTLTLTSTSWRVTAPMRALKRRLAPDSRTSR